jgi:hypothetical protein
MRKEGEREYEEGGGIGRMSREKEGEIEYYYSMSREKEE